MFVVSKHAQELGVGKLLGQAGPRSRVEWFDHPGHSGRIVKDVPTAGLQARPLQVQSRVYFRTDAGTWLAGRVSEIRADAIEVQFEWGGFALLKSSELYVRSAIPLEDPSKFLASFVSDRHSLFTMRHSFMRQAVAQRGLAAGLEGLLSASVELVPHQMAVVRRVVTDPVQRYLLADEVGLGKTVEAAAIVRQHVIDDPRGHRVAIVVPRPLVGQWRDELARRFHLGPPFLDDSINIVHPGDDDLDDALHGANLVVVDEAHNLFGHTDEARGQTTANLEKIRRACLAANALLLLSATPAISDEETYFEMMQLIDPDLFSADQRDAFTRKIANRQELALIAAGFVPEAMQMLMADADRLQQMFPNDRRLEELLVHLIPIAEASVAPDQPDLVLAVEAVRMHLRETYRLHRRILRNRRKNAPNLTPDRTPAELLTYEDPVVEVLERQIENWRLALATEGKTDATRARVYVGWLRCLAEGGSGLLAAVRERHDRVVRTLASPAEAELLEGMLHQLTSWDPWAPRLRALEEAVAQTITARTKLVVFCSDPTDADRCFDALTRRHPTAVVRHDPRAPGDDRRDVNDWTRFISDGNCAVVVCDREAEEGLNLQGGRKTILHADLPMAPNRLEQRLGRVDRFGDGDRIRTKVLVCADSLFARHWAQCVTDGFGVMERSIASLQYLVNDRMTALQDSLFREGLDAIVTLTRQLGGEDGLLRRELRKVDQQDELEALQAPEPESFEELLDADSEWEIVRDAVEPWIHKGLRFRREVMAMTPSTVDPVVRYRHAGLGVAGTLMPPGQFRRDFFGALDTETPRPGNGLSSHAYTYRRSTASRRFVRPLRAGDSLMEGLVNLARVDDRGRAFALWRAHSDYRKAMPGGDLFLRFDFVVEADVEPAMELFPHDDAASARQQALARRMDQVLPPRHASVWLDRGLGPVIADVPNRWLEGTVPGSVDRDIERGHWLHMRKAGTLDVLAAWGDFLDQARDIARGLAGSDPEQRRLCERAHARHTEQDEAAFARLENRIVTTAGRERQLEEGRLAMERELGRCLAKGLIAPRVRLDGVGVVILSNLPLLTL